MNFFSIEFVIFVGLLLFGYYVLFKKKQWICLLIASGLFYYATGIENFLFILLTGFTTWYGGRKLANYAAQIQEIRKNKELPKEERKEKREVIEKKRRRVMWIVVLVNFGVLAVLKYLEPVLHGIGMLDASEGLGLLLPLGISFYTFQSVGYLLDIYYEKYAAEEHFGKYMLFVSYFPQLIQGPINRFDMMAGQLFEEHSWDSERNTKAMYRIFYGFLKKYAIANILSVMIANVFDNPVIDFSGAMVVFAILLYSAQQYADFSGGIDIVLGVSELFGIHMMENFRQPYFATSLADFWRRWHISLGKWMRDYVFYPFAVTKPMKNLGKWATKRIGKHVGRVLPAMLGNILVFFIVGIWHGAEWHYVAWGLYNGIIIALSDLLAPVYDKVAEVLRIDRKAKWYHVFQVLRTFIVVNIGWYFDRIVSVKDAFYSMKKTVFEFNPGLFHQEFLLAYDGIKSHGLKIAVMACFMVFVISLLEERKMSVRELLYKSPLMIRWAIYVFVTFVILFASMRVGDISGGFMYANF